MFLCRRNRASLPAANDDSHFHSVLCKPFHLFGHPGDGRFVKSGVLFSCQRRGKIEGNVRCNGKVTITGSIHGNAEASEFFADAAKVEGEISTSGTVKIGLGSVVVGNITATSAVIAGAIKGDIDVQGPVVVDTSAVVMGNIKSRSVQINNGAVIEGFCSQCYADVDMETFFDK